MKDITVEELYQLDHPAIIDIRSPVEFKDGAIPGAINIPLFTDDERKEIGTIYKQVGQDAAKWKAMQFVSPKIPDLLQSIKDATAHSGEQPIIHCWRGGMRSKAVVTFLDFAGIRAKRLAGGYKAYRQYILQEIRHLLPERAIVLHGLTGVGKTEILKLLNGMGYPVLDLEEMAAHRGSIFGTIGIGNGHNQKTFDSLLHKRLREIQGSSYFLMEAESKRIGKATQPEELMTKKINGIHIYLHTSMEARVKHIANEYIYPYEHDPWYYNEIKQSLERIFPRMKDVETKTRLQEYLESREYTKMIKILLEDYYDPKYDHKRQDYIGEFIDIYAESHQEAAEKVAKHLEALSIKPQSV
ncbi:tRNA 2-selenouridine(34) synthase MnmH [Bacillota bacterium Lsc_1132]